MEKYLVEISIPALGQTVDARLPGGVTFAQAARLVLAAAGGEGVAAEFFRPDGTAYPPDAEISRSDLCSGMHLVLL